MSYVVKAAMPETDAKVFSFPAQKTMYGGKNVAVKDEIFLFASENKGGRGLIALGVVTAAASAPTVRSAGGRGTPRVSITVRRIASAKIVGITPETAVFLRSLF